MMKLPKRDDEIYKEIESFEDYELTNNVSYEMLIRNDEVLKIINNIKDCENKNKFYEDLKRYGITYNYPLYANYYFIDSDVQIIIDELNSLISENNHPRDYIARQWSEAFGANKYSTNYCNGYRHYSSMEVHLKNEYKLKDKYEKIADYGDAYEKIEQKFEKNRWYSEDEIENILNFSTLVLNITKMFERKTVQNELEAYKHNEDNGGFEDSVILQEPKRPKLKFKGYSKDTKIIVNMALPLNEIIAYVTHVKNDIDKNNLIKAPLELLGEELQKADNLICDTKGNCFDTRKVLKKQQKIADMLYIYDCLKLGATQVRIRNEIFNYYSNIGIKTKTLEYSTIKRYKEIAIDYIDNMRYKELITGVKLQ